MATSLLFYNRGSSLMIIIVALFSCFFNRISAGCYTSIISFGDSITDTGNGMQLEHNKYYQSLPYGETFKYGPTGRCSNGRLIIDFIAETMGLSFIPPYLGHPIQDFKQGVNFAVVGATALDATFFRERDLQAYTNYNLKNQLKWFQQMVPSLCNSTSNCQNLFQNTLFLVGEIGGNDYSQLLVGNTSKQEISTYAPQVVAKISSIITALINEGAMTLVVPGIFPLGCYPFYLTLYQSRDMNEYDASGCLKYINGISQFHNRLLQDELKRLRKLYPHVHILYADYYNAAIDLFRRPTQLGFRSGALIVCCGAGGPYNCNPDAKCGAPQSTVCDDVSLYVLWDGLHFTDSAHKLITTRLLEGSFIIPHIDFSCRSSY